ncbi:hypothetical protein M405DRAFT_828188, partial [Rhizopogon salebrosus TDB-379]
MCTFHDPFREFLFDEAFTLLALEHHRACITTQYQSSVLSACFRDLLGNVGTEVVTAAFNLFCLKPLLLRLSATASRHLARGTRSPRWRQLYSPWALDIFLRESVGFTGDDVLFLSHFPRHRQDISPNESLLCNEDNSPESYLY